jgi:drug/metabolite transporter (DMT)-like permease
MIAVIGGLITAVCWAAATLSAARASRSIGPWSTTSWVVLIGLAPTIPLLMLDRLPGPGDLEDLAVLGVVGVAYVVGLVLNYAALRGGKIPVAAPVASTEGAIAASLAILAGETAGAPLLALLLIVVVGIVLTTLEPSTEHLDVPVGGDRRYVLFALTAAVAFGISLYASGRASATVPLAWVMAAGRVAGLALVAIPVILTGQLRITRVAVPFVIACALLEVAGFLTFAWGARDSIAVTAVLSSQFAVIAAVVAHLMGERIALRQWLGVGTVAAAVGGITLLRL